MNSFASLCVLSYKRTALLRACIESIIATSDYPYQLIVNSDGGDDENFTYLTKMLQEKKISSLILNSGGNRGVGRSFQNCLGLCEGNYIFKIDTDLTFKQGWLSESIRALDINTDVGAIGLFDYNKWDPEDARFKPDANVIEQRETCNIVKDFVSCIYGFRAKDKYIIEPVEDDGNHLKFVKLGTKLALTKESMVENTSFGVGKSVYVSGTMDHPFKTATFHNPLIF